MPQEVQLDMSYHKFALEGVQYIYIIIIIIYICKVFSSLSLTLFDKTQHCPYMGYDRRIT